MIKKQPRAIAKGGLFMFVREIQGFKDSDLPQLVITVCG